MVGSGNSINIFASDLRRVRRAAIFVAIAEVLAAISLAPRLDGIWPLAFVHIVAAAIFATVAFWESNAEYRDIHYAATFGILVAGPVGAFAIAICTFRLTAKVVTLRDVERSDFADALVRNIRSGSVRRVEGPTSFAFRKLMLNGVPDQQLSLLQLLATDYHSDYSEILHSALRADSISVRASAAALVTSLKKQTAFDFERALQSIELSSETRDVESSVRTLIDCIESGFLIGRQLERAKAAAAALANDNGASGQNYGVLAAAEDSAALVVASQHLPKYADQSAKDLLAKGLMRIGRHDHLRRLLHDARGHHEA